MAEVVDGSVEQARIAELEKLKTQRVWWRWGITVATAGYITFCLARLNTSVRGLAEQGPVQESFVRNLSTSLQADTLPMIQREATSTVTEIQPEVKAAVYKLRDRVPELTQAAQTEIVALQESLPAKGEDILNKKFASILVSREPLIRKMYPQITPDQLNMLVVNLTEHGKQQLIGANDEIFGPHQAKLQSIMRNMAVIRDEEAHNVRFDEPDWEMATLLLDIFRGEYKDVEDARKKEEKELAMRVTTNHAKGETASSRTK